MGQVVDWDRHIRYVMYSEKAWAFSWKSLTDLANWILAVMLRTVQVYNTLPPEKGHWLRQVKGNPMYRIYGEHLNPRCDELHG